MSKVTLFAALAVVASIPSLCLAQAPTVKVGPNGKSNTDGTTTIKNTKVPGAAFDPTNPVESVTVDGTTYTGDQIKVRDNPADANSKFVDVSDPNLTGDCDVTVEVKLAGGTKIKTPKTKVRVKSTGTLEEDECDDEFIRDDAQS